MPDDEDEQGDETRVTEIREIPLSGPITDVPEFHDCQRFIVRSQKDNSEVYDSLYAIYASDSLDFVDTALSLLVSDPDDTAAVAAATIYSYGGTYSSLGIGSGFNCLYLSRVDTTWGAWMLPKGANEPDCQRRLEEIDEVPGVKRLHAIPLRLTGAGFQDYPPVARWDWDTLTERQLIGIKCGAAWCIVSDQPSANLVPAPQGIGFDDPQSTAVAHKPVLGIRGWYDSQRLAHRGPYGRVVPSDVWGFLIPHPTLSDDAMEAYSDGWVHVARIWVSADYDGAVLKLKAKKPHDLYLCGSNCPDFPQSDRPTCNTPQGASRFWSRMTHRSGIGGAERVTVFACVVRRPTEHGPVPGTARWRWLANDETSWTRCYEGCCELK